MKKAYRVNSKVKKLFSNRTQTDIAKSIAEKTGDPGFTNALFSYIINGHASPNVKTAKAIHEEEGLYPSDYLPRGTYNLNAMERKLRKENGERKDLSHAGKRYWGIWVDKPYQTIIDDLKLHNATGEVLSDRDLHLHMLDLAVKFAQGLLVEVALAS